MTDTPTLDEIEDRARAAAKAAMGWGDTPPASLSGDEVVEQFAIGMTTLCVALARVVDMISPTRAAAEKGAELCADAIRKHLADVADHDRDRKRKNMDLH